MEIRMNDSLLLTLTYWFPRKHQPHRPQTCAGLAVDERQAWLHQVRLLQIPIPPGTAPSKRQLKDWAVSRVKADVRSVESLGGEDG